MKTLLRQIALAATILAFAPPLLAANVPYLTGPTGSNPAQFPADIPDINNTITGINAATTPQATAQTNVYRNYLDNGGLEVQQRGTGAIAGGTTTGVTSANYSADRFVVDTNVASGAGYSQVVNTSPYLGASAYLKVYRNSGALTQPVCLIQEIPTTEAVDLQGQSVVFSSYLQALAGFTAANSAVTVSVIYGTGTDQGLQSAFTASPAITPAWTGIGVAGTATFNTSTAWTRYISAPIIIPITATEVGIELCFTPVGSASGTTDGFALADIQLEQSSTTASTFENRPYGVELAKDQRYFWQFADAAATTRYGMGQATTATTAVFVLPTPTTMRVAPTVTVGTATSFGLTVAAGTAGTCSTLATVATSTTINSIALGCTTASTMAAGNATQMIGGGTTGVVTVSSDF